VVEQVAAAASDRTLGDPILPGHRHGDRDAGQVVACAGAEERG
jgi:hypothetical protein